jgi:hypothetical protein
MKSPRELLFEIEHHLCIIFSSLNDHVVTRAGITAYDSMSFTLILYTIGPIYL